MFNHLFSTHGIDAVLVPAHVPPSQLNSFVHHVMAASNIDMQLLTQATPNETQRLVFAIKGFAQANAPYALPWKEWPYYIRIRRLRSMEFII